MKIIIAIIFSYICKKYPKIKAKIMEFVTLFIGYLIIIIMIESFFEAVRELWV